MDFAAELQSITAFDETRVVPSALRKTGYHIVILSNLPHTYRQAIHGVIGTFLDADNCASQVGAATARIRIYAALCAQLEVLPDEVLAISCATEACDGVRHFGMCASELYCKHDAGGEPAHHVLKEILLPS